jgi:hypothetical protein
MTNNLCHIVPPGVRRFLAQAEKREEAKAKERAARISTLLAEGKRDEAIELLTGQRCPVSARVQRFVDRIPEPEKRTDRSAAATAVRQHKIVETLTSGQRCSLNRAYKLAGYGSHRESLDHLLSSPTVLDLFQRAVDQGRSLPAKYKERIENALEDRELGIV